MPDNKPVMDSGSGSSISDLKANEALLRKLSTVAWDMDVIASVSGHLALWQSLPSLDLALLICEMRTPNI